ncbi:hypothetical protein [Streptomyces sp. NPDC018972]|uniref:hypothetical protein n=1 Tax=Streptomyces sp. NPDC018972 TaxID=3365060 RepID=UPI0037B2D9BD
MDNQGIGDPVRTAAHAKAITDKDVTEVGTEVGAEAPSAGQVADMTDKALRRS